MPHCSKYPDPRFIRAIRQFDAGDYFASHETLEELWKQESRPVRDVYKGVLMLAVGLHHNRRGKRKGPLRTFNRAVELLSPFGPYCLGLDIAAVIDAARRMRKHLAALPEGERVPTHLVPDLGGLLGD